MLVPVFLASTAWWLFPVLRVGWDGVAGSSRVVVLVRPCVDPRATSRGDVMAYRVGRCAGEFGEVRPGIVLGRVERAPRGRGDGMLVAPDPDSWRVAGPDASAALDEALARVREVPRKALIGRVVWMGRTR